MKRTREEFESENKDEDPTDPQDEVQTRSVAKVSKSFGRRRIYVGSQVAAPPNGKNTVLLPRRREDLRNVIKRGAPSLLALALTQRTSLLQI